MRIDGMIKAVRGAATIEQVVAVLREGEQSGASLLDLARAAARRGEIYQAAIKSPAGGWMRKHGILRDGKVYTHHNAYFPRGVDDADSGKWRLVPADEVDTLLAYIERGDKRSTYYTAAVNLLSTVESTDKLIAEGRANIEQGAVDYTGDPALNPDLIRRMAEGSNRAEAREAERRAEWDKGHAERMADIEARQPTWQTFEGLDVLRVGESPFVAVPASGRKNAARFDIIDLRDRSDIVAQVDKAEVNSWLTKAGPEPEKAPAATGGLTLYHGTSEGNTFTAFDSSRANSGVGQNSRDQGNHFYLTASLTAARWFADRADQGQKLMDGVRMPFDPAGTVLKFKVAPSARVLELENMPRGHAAQPVIEQAQEDGYDGIAFPDRGFETVEGDEGVGKMINTEGLPTTYIFWNHDVLSSAGTVSASSDEPEPLLSTYSESDLAEQARHRAQAEMDQALIDREAEQRARADAEALDFTLTGSNREADVAAAAGQVDLLGAGAESLPQRMERPEPDVSAPLAPEGRFNEVRTAKGTKVQTGFTAVEAARLIASHTADGKVNPDFPQELQPRDRSRQSSQTWIKKVARDLDPGLLGRTKKADSGAPIIGPDRIVESGNGRALSIIEAYKLGTADEYREWLMEDAESLGLDPQKIASMTAPVLVRVRTSDIDRRAFAVEANQDDKLAMTATEKARADAGRLTPQLLASFNPGGDGDLLAKGNRDFIKGFLASLGEAEAAQYITSTGEPTGTLIARIQAAVFAKAYEDERLLELMADTAQPENRNVISALCVAAPEFIQARAANEAGTQKASEQLAESVAMSLDNEAVRSLIDATNIVRQAKRDGMTVEEYVSQMGLFGDMDPGVAAMAIFIAQNNRSAKRLATAFKAMAEFVRDELAHSAAGSDMFGDHTVSMADVVAAANRVMEREYGNDQYAIRTAQESQGLFESVENIRSRALAEYLA